ncbi:MAG: glycosyltransferase, partial [Bifidobacteriaceae bacterium]|nr:glycosyltransferase [Bifidobacteriaceae bacterium]
LVYGGGVHPARGIQTAIQALPQLPGAHLVVVARQGELPAELAAMASRLGVAGRVHSAPFADHDQVVGYLASADLGLSPLLRVANHDLTVTNKFWEYLLAGLPVLTSDTPEQARLVAELGLGAVHRAGDPDDFARAARALLAQLPELKRRLAGADLGRFAWEAQVPTLERLWGELAGALLSWDAAAPRPRRGKGTRGLG